MSDSLLVIDDDPTFNAVLVQALSRRGIDAHGCIDPDTALNEVDRLRPLRVVLDLNLGGASGLGLIMPILGIVPNCGIVVLTGYASIATAVDAVKLGAIQYLAKPVDVDTILAAFDSSDTPVGDTIEAVPLSVERLEWEHIQRVLNENGGNISATARLLKMHRRTLQRKLMKRPVRA